MSRRWTDLKEFSCTNACGDSGAECRHKMRIVYICTSDHVVVEIDPKPEDRPGSGTWSYSFDDSAFKAMIDLATGK